MSLDREGRRDRERPEVLPDSRAGTIHIFKPFTPYCGVELRCEVIPQNPLDCVPLGTAAYTRYGFVTIVISPREGQVGQGRGEGLHYPHEPSKMTPMVVIGSGLLGTAEVVEVDRIVRRYLIGQLGTEGLSVVVVIDLIPAVGDHPHQGELVGDGIGCTYARMSKGDSKAKIERARIVVIDGRPALDHLQPEVSDVLTDIDL